MATKTKTVTLSTKGGPVEVAAVWAGAALAVHRPLGLPAEMQRGQWTISHLLSGLRLCPFSGSQDAACKFARSWDARAALLTDPAQARAWDAKHRFSDAWKAAGQFPQSQVVASRKPEIVRGNGGEQFPAEPIVRRKTITLPDGTETTILCNGSIRLDPTDLSRGIDGTLSLLFRSKWYEVPSMAEVMTWTFDSVCETPDGRTVEHDAPDSWLRLLGLV